MTTSSWFDDLPVMGRLAPEQAAAKLREMGEAEAAAACETVRATLRPNFGTSKWWPFQDRPWQHTAHAFGYLAPAPPGIEQLSIHHAGNIAADPTLKRLGSKSPFLACA